MGRPEKGRQEKKSAHPTARRRLDLKDSPPKSPPSQDEVIDLTSPKKKRGMDKFLTNKEDTFQTPPKPSKRAKTKESDKYVPTYIHKNVEYKRKGVATLSEETVGTYKLVEKHYSIPQDLETSRKYGPLSGQSYEERVIAAYSLGLLEPRDTKVDICSECAVEGHRRNDCPTLI